MRSFQLALLIFVFGTTTCGVANAQLNEWERTHPDGPENSLGGFVRELSTSADGVTYITSGFGRYYSRTNAAEAWENYTPQLDGQPIESYNYYPHPTIPGRITSNGPNGSVYRSMDYGRTWSSLTVQNSIYIAARSPINSGTFYASEFSGDNLYRSSDEGVSWSTIPLTDISSVRDLEIDSTDENILYALDGQRINKSVDGGSSWQVMEQGTGSLWYMNDLAIDPFNPQKLYAASGAFTYAFRTDDGAANWELKILPNLPGTGSPMEAIKVDPSNGDNIYAVGGRSSIHSSGDGGLNWIQYVDLIGNGDWYNLTISNTGAVVLGGTAGTAVPQASGSIELTNQGLSDFSMTVLRKASGDPRFMYAGGFSGLAVYDSENGQWSLRTRPFDNNVSGIAVNAKNSEHVIVASFFGGLHESTDAGISWQEILLPVGSNFGLDIRMAPSNPEILYVRTEAGMHRSGDAGESWELVLDSTLFNIGGVKFPIEISPVNPDIVNVGTYSFGIYTTLDGGQSWTNTANMFPDNRVSEITIDPRYPSTVYATLYGGYLLQSLNSGTTWAEFDTSGTFGGFRTVAVDPSVPGRLFLFSANRLFAFEPSLRAWNEVGPQLDGFCGFDSCQVLIDPERQGYVTVAASGELSSIQRDFDADLLGDDVDNCTLVHNPDQRDTDNDGYGNFCDPDFNNDLVVNFLDIVVFSSAYLTSDPNVDLNGDGTVNFIDLVLLRNFYLRAPGPAVNGLL